MTDQQLALTAYYEAVDRSAFDEALAHVSPTFRFAIMVPGATVRGEDHSLDGFSSTHPSPSVIAAWNERPSVVRHTPTVPGR